jgi:hypothetical protein
MPRGMPETTIGASLVVSVVVPSGASPVPESSPPGVIPEGPVTPPMPEEGRPPPSDRPVPSVIGASMGFGPGVPPARHPEAPPEAAKTTKIRSIFENIGIIILIIGQNIPGIVNYYKPLLELLACILTA